MAIGNAPTALFRLLEILRDGAPRPAAVIGMPVGFVGAAESKEALAEDPPASRSLIVRGRLGGSAHDGGRRQRAGEAQAMSAGRLIGVGTGPGDPELLTLKAVRALARGRRGGAFRQGGKRATPAPSSRRICATGVVELPLLYPVTTEIDSDDPAYRRGDRGLLRAVGARRRGTSRRRPRRWRC